MGICRAIGKEKISTSVCLVGYAVISQALFVTFVWVLELGLNSFFWAYVLMYC